MEKPPYSMYSNELPPGANWAKDSAKPMWETQSQKSSAHFKIILSSINYNCTNLKRPNMRPENQIDHVSDDIRV
jgi:hypothetical protein